MSDKIQTILSKTFNTAKLPQSMSQSVTQSITLPTNNIKEGTMMNFGYKPKIF